MTCITTDSHLTLFLVLSSLQVIVWDNELEPGTSTDPSLAAIRYISGNAQLRAAAAAGATLQVQQRQGSQLQMQPLQQAQPHHAQAVQGADTAVHVPSAAVQAARCSAVQAVQAPGMGARDDAGVPQGAVVVAVGPEGPDVLPAGADPTTQYSMAVGDNPSMARAVATAPDSPRHVSPPGLVSVGDLVSVPVGVPRPRSTSPVHPLSQGRTGARSSSPAHPPSHTSTPTNQLPASGTTGMALNVSGAPGAGALIGQPRQATPGMSHQPAAPAIESVPEDRSLRHTPSYSSVPIMLPQPPLSHHTLSSQHHPQAAAAPTAGPGGLNAASDNVTALQSHAGAGAGQHQSGDQGQNTQEQLQVLSQQMAQLQAMLQQVLAAKQG